MYRPKQDHWLQVLETVLTYSPGLAETQLQLRAFVDAGVAGCVVRLVKEGAPANAPLDSRCVPVDTTIPLADVLRGCVIVEYPRFVVALGERRTLSNVSVVDTATAPVLDELLTDNSTVRAARAGDSVTAKVLAGTEHTVAAVTSHVATEPVAVSESAGEAVAGMEDSDAMVTSHIAAESVTVSESAGEAVAVDVVTVDACAVEMTAFRSEEAMAGIIAADETLSCDMVTVAKDALKANAGEAVTLSEVVTGNAPTISLTVSKSAGKAETTHQ